MTTVFLFVEIVFFNLQTYLWALPLQWPEEEEQASMHGLDDGHTSQQSDHADA